MSGSDNDSGQGRDPAEPWQHLYQATIGALSGALGNGDLDAFGFHRQWLADKQGAEGATGGDTPAFYRQLAGWTTESVRRTTELAAVMARLIPRCSELVQNVPRQMVADGLPTDPLDFTQRLYEATSGPLSAIIRDLLTDDAFLQLSRRLLENWATAESLAAQLAEDVFRRLQLSTTSDTTRLATLIVGLDEKVDRLDDALDDLEHGQAARAGSAELATLREQVGRLEAKLDRLLDAHREEAQR